MECLTVVLSTLAAKPLEAVARLLCRPCNDEIQNSIEVLSKPEILDDNLRELSNMAHEIRGMRSSDEIKNWVSEADKILRECSSTNLADDRPSCCCFSSNARLRCKLQKQIKRLMGQGNGIKRANLLPRSVEQIHGVPIIEDDTTAGKNLKKVMDILEDDAVWMIGLWGPGGVGKTTLAKALNNRLEETSSFSMVIYVEITKGDDLKDMQKDIAKRLGEKVEEGMDTRDLEKRIRNRLEKEKFLLIVDNVWEHIDLPSIGIPEKKEASKSKIVLTTRLLDVCQKMNAKELRIGYLTHEEAWQLFAEKAGDVVDKEEIRPLAKTVCQECGRLPLAVITVGLAMREKNIHLWKSAINRLQQASFINGDKSPVNRALKLSYDWLEDEILRRCFFYCSLYPEGYTIDVHELVGCWLAEEVIDEQLCYGDAFNEVLDLIEKLTSSCLLEKSTFWSYKDGSYYVRMHDVVRDFARLIAEQNGCKILSGHGKSKDQAVKFPEVDNLEWISVVDNRKIELPQYTKDFPKVTTLLLHGSREHGVEVLHEFLEGFQKLRVLNMQEVLSFPGYSLCLAELRAIFCSRGRLASHCPHVEEIPCMPKLIILDLSGCLMNKIPRGVRELTHLKVLNLSGTRHLKSVEADTISNLTSLEVLDMRTCGYAWPTKRKSNSKKATLKDLSELKKLKSVYLDLADKECSYEDCKWMESLENFDYQYRDGRLNQQPPMGKEMTIIDERKSGGAGSFILHAESLTLEGLVDVNEIFLNSNSIDQFNSKLKRLWMFNCTFSRKSIGPAPNCIALSHLEKLLFSHGDGKDELSFSQIADSLGTTFSELRVLEVYYSYYGEPSIKAKNFFSSNDPQMELPKLEEIILEDGKNMIEVFHHGPTENHVVAPNLRRLQINNLPMLERLCNYELTEQWKSLEILNVFGCPNLKKLPKMPCIKKIRGEVSWWNNLEWDSLDTKSAMDQIFKSTPTPIPVLALAREFDAQCRAFRLVRELLDFSETRW